MSSQTNIALNSRSMNSIITLSDGVATIENGELNCSNINSNLATIQNLTTPTLTADDLINCTLTNCDVSADPTVALGIASKQYVDTAVSGLVSLTSTQTFTGINTFSNTTEFDGAINSYDQNTFYGFCPKAFIPPTISTNLTNKNYVDGEITSLTTTLTTLNTTLKTLITKNYGGVYLLKAIAGAGNYISFPLTTSRTNLTNWTSQPSTSGALTTAQSGTVVGNFSSINVNDADTLYLVLPLYGLIVYQNSGYTGSIYLNYKNTTTAPVVVAPSTALGGTSIKIYYDDTEQT